MRIIVKMSILLTFISCRNPGRINTIYYSSRDVLADSFTIEGVRSLSGFLNVELLSDTELFMYNMEGSSMDYFYRKEKKEQFRFRNSVSVNDGQSLQAFFKLTDNSGWGIVDDTNQLYLYDKSFNRGRQIDLPVHFGKLGKNVNLVSNMNAPMLMLRNDILGSYCYRDISDYNVWLHEKQFFKISIINDSFCKSSSFFEKPPGLYRFFLPAPSFCYYKEGIICLYPCYDTLYYFHFENQLTEKVSLNNPDFSLPQLWDNNEMFGPDFSSYRTKYEISNFRYEGVFFNENTRHFIFFYVVPMPPVDDGVPLPTEQKRYALVMDSNFKKVGSFSFDRHFFNPSNYFIIPGKGLAMPVFLNKSSYENTMYYIFNF